MKKTLCIGMCGLVLAVAGGTTLHANAAVVHSSPEISQKVGQEVTVSSFNELSDALTDANVTSIKIGGDITFDRNIGYVPVRDITIDGQGHNLQMSYYRILGASGLSNGAFSIKNTNITNLTATNLPVSTFFEAGDEHWSVNILGGVNYTGERFLEVQNSVVTFAGKNTVHTSAENAWVRSINFAANSEYSSTAATEGEFSAFYFSGNLVGGKAVGKVNVESKAKVDITVSPNNDTNFYFPAFYNKVDRINVKDGATLNITAAGHAIQFIPRGDYDETPSVNVENNATLNLVGHGGGGYSTVSFQQPDAQLNAKEGSTVYVEGKAANLFETAANNAVNITDSNYDFRNTLAGGHLFNSPLNSQLNLSQVTLSTWNKTGGDYEEAPTHAWDTLSLGTIITGQNSVTTVSTNPDAQSVFQIADYGRITGNIIKP